MARGRVIRTDFAGLRGALERAAAGRRVVGFDVFDTLVRRRVEPETVKDRVAVMLAERLGRPGEWRALRARRAALERALWEERLRDGQDGESALRELVERWLADVAPAGPDLVSETIAAELGLERRAQALAPGIAALLPALAAAGKRLVFVSDMYLPAADIRDLLDGLGIGPHFAAGYVSCDHGRRKTTGRLFQHLLEHEGIAPEDLVFVGDNPHADVEPARSLGITVVHVRDPKERKRRLALQVAEWAAGRSPLWQGELAYTVVETIPGRVRAGRSPHYDLGLTLAPAFVAFMLHVIERVQADALREVYFLSREGWLLLRLYRRLTRALGLAGALPRGRYLFASRLATFLPSMARLDWPELQRMWRQYHHQSLRLLLANLGLPADEFAPLARRAAASRTWTPRSPIPGTTPASAASSPTTRSRAASPSTATRRVPRSAPTSRRSGSSAGAPSASSTSGGRGPSSRTSAARSPATRRSRPSTASISPPTPSKRRSAGRSRASSPTDGAATTSSTASSRHRRRSR